MTIEEIMGDVLADCSRQRWLAGSGNFLDVIISETGPNNPNRKGALRILGKLAAEDEGRSGSAKLH